jgi:flagellar hook-associated protein 3 FlgL
MISSLNPSTQRFLNALNQISENLQQAQLQISSGLKVSQVSDAPDSVSALLQARANLSAAQQNQANLGRFQSEADGGERALQTAVQLFDQVQTLGAEGDTDTATASTRTDLAQQLGAILQQMGNLANTSVEGRYIFSGDSDQQAAYSINLSSATPVSAYTGSASTRVAQYPDGNTFPVALTAQTIFDSANPATNVFSAITGLMTALNSNNDTAIQTAVAGLDQTGAYLNTQLAFYGNAQDNIAQATNDTQSLQTQLQTQISNLQDADVTSSITELTQEQTQEQAALESEALVPRTTLFDFLH